MAAEAARAAPSGPDPPRAVDVLLDELALRLTDGYAAAAPEPGPGEVLVRHEAIGVNYVDTQHRADAPLP